jgi:hypothetical protein
MKPAGGLARRRSASAQVGRAQIGGHVNRVHRALIATCAAPPCAPPEPRGQKRWSRVLFATPARYLLAHSAAFHSIFRNSVQDWTGVSAQPSALPFPSAECRRHSLMPTKWNKSRKVAVSRHMSIFFTKPLPQTPPSHPSHGYTVTFPDDAGTACAPWGGAAGKQATSPWPRQRWPGAGRLQDAVDLDSVRDDPAGAIHRARLSPRPRPTRSWIATSLTARFRSTMTQGTPVRARQLLTRSYGFVQRHGTARRQQARGLGPALREPADSMITNGFQSVQTNKSS